MQRTYIYFFHVSFYIHISSLTIQRANLLQIAGHILFKVFLRFPYYLLTFLLPQLMFRFSLLDRARLSFAKGSFLSLYILSLLVFCLIFWEPYKDLQSL